MKKFVFLSLFAWCLPWTLAAQNVDDDLYYTPAKSEVEALTPQKAAATTEKVVVKTNVPTTVYSSGNTTVVVKDHAGKTRDVDAYNRRYETRANDYAVENDTLYVDQVETVDDGLGGEWIDGFDGSEDDYEYATRIIRFRNPRYAVSISSPLYWDIVYGLNSWDWNIYVDGLYAYAFPTFTNRLWWSWRYSYWGYPYYWGWPYYSWSWSGWWGHYHHPNWGWGGNHWAGAHWGNVHTGRHSFGPVRSSNFAGGAGSRVSASTRSAAMNRGGAQSVRRGSTNAASNRRVVGTRTGNTRSSGVSRSSGVTRSNTMTRSSVGRSDAASSRRSVYTRPSSTRSSSYSGSTGVRSTTRSNSTYTRGSSGTATRSYSSGSTRSHSSYSAPTHMSGSTRSSFSSGGGSFRSGGGGGGARSGGGGGSRR